MQIKKEDLENSLKKLLDEYKGKRNFTQTVELIINFRGVDFKKPENKLNLTIYLPKGKGSKPTKFVIIGDEAFSYDAKKKGLNAYSVAEFLSFKEKEVKALTKDHYFLVQPKVIGEVAKKFGKILGQRGKTPIPLVGNLDALVERMKSMIKVQTKGKYMPTVQAPIGTEDMDVNDLAENALAVLNEISKKISTSNIKNIYLKLTMSKPIRVG